MLFQNHIYIYVYVYIYIYLYTMLHETLQGKMGNAVVAGKHETKGAEGQEKQF